MSSKFLGKTPKTRESPKQIAGTPLRLGIGRRRRRGVLADLGMMSSCPLCQVFPWSRFPASSRRLLSHLLGTRLHLTPIRRTDAFFSVTKPVTGKVRVHQIDNMGDNIWDSMRLDDKLPFARSLANRSSSTARGKRSLSDELPKSNAGCASRTCLSERVCGGSGKWRGTTNAR